MSSISRSGWDLFGALALAGCAMLAAEATLEDRAPAAATVEAAKRRDVASWYGAWHHGRPTASGEAFDMHALTAAHRSLPLGRCVEVEHVGSGRRVVVRVNDRGPYIDGRTIDLSFAAARALGMVRQGVAPVRIRKTAPAACRDDGAPEGATS